MNIRSRSLGCSLFALACLGLLVSRPIRAQEPPAAPTKLTAPQLFPEKTLAYVRVNDVKELKEAMSRSSMGKLSQDEQIRPILAEFYGSLINSTETIREMVGLNLDELLSIPSGEMAVALLPTDQTATRQRGQGNNRNDSEPAVQEVTEPSVAVMLDAAEEIAGVQVLLDRMQKALPGNMVHSESKLGSLTIHKVANPERVREQFAYFIDQGVFVGASNVISLERLAKRWMGAQVEWPSLAENRKFTSIMGRCVGTTGERPQVSFYVDPLLLARQTIRSTGANVVFAVLPALGLNDIEALGGSWIIAPPDFDMISHFHLLLGTPRRSVLALLRPKSGSTTPEDWVPASVGSYFTINWDAAATLKGIEQLYDQFQGEGEMKRQVFDQVSNRLSLDFKKDILDNIEGRFTLVQGFVRPVRINSGSNVYGIRLNNPEFVQKNVLPKLLELVQQRVEVKSESFGKLQAQVFTPPRGRENATIRQPEICITFIDDYLVISDSRFMMTEIAATLNSPDDRLNQALDFQLIADRIKAQLQDKTSSALSYARPEESLQMFYELAREPGNRDRLREVSSNNGFFKALLAALDNHKLPEFSVIAKYLAPTGGFLVEEETGMHYMSFGLRRE